MSVFTMMRRRRNRSSGTVRQPVFVIGCGRSGTTMLFEILKGHPQLLATTGHPDGEDHVGWVTHGKAIISGIYGNATTSDNGHVVGYTCCLSMGRQDATDEIRTAMHRYYAEKVLGGRANLRVLNKCPHLSNKVEYVHAIFPDAKFVHIVRNPVAMTASWVNIMKDVPDLVLYWPDADLPCFWVFDRQEAMARASLFMHDSRFYPGGGLHRFADYWAATNGNIELQAETFQSQILAVRYEDLAANPDSVVRQITDFCELEPIKRLPITIDPTRNELRRELLTRSDVAEIRRRTAAVATRFGYADPN